MATGQPKKLSLNDIAKLSGVSAATVSRVINGYPHVSDEKRRRVMEVVKKHNFQPNSVARALASNSSRVLGIVIPELVNEVFADPFFANMIQSITHNANKLRYDVTLWLTAQHDEERILQRIINDSITDGLIIIETSIDQKALDLLNQHQKNYVLIGRPAANQNVTNFVDVENYEGGKLMANYLIENNRKRIAIIPGRDDIPSAVDRISGYVDALNEHDLPVIIGKHGHFTESGGYIAMQELLSHDVDAVFVCSDLMAIGAIRAIEEAGLVVGKDIAVGGFDDMQFASMKTTMRLTTIRQPIEMMAFEAVSGLISQLQGEKKDVFHKILPVKLVVRETA